MSVKNCNLVLRLFFVTNDVADKKTALHQRS